MMKSHEIDYKIIGHDIQLVEIELDPNETVIAEAGMMNYLEDDISFEPRLGDGSVPKQGIMGAMLGVGKRWLTGESIFLTHFTNMGASKRRLGFAAPYPGTIIPIDLAAYGNNVICQKDAFLVASLGTKIGVALTKRISTGFFGGEGFVLQTLQGDGNAFLHAGGSVFEKKLNNESIRIATGSLVAFTPTLDYKIEMVNGLKSMLFGGEGLFFTTLQGTGSVWIQSLPFMSLVQRVLQFLPPPRPR